MRSEGIFAPREGEGLRENELIPIKSHYQPIEKWVRGVFLVLPFRCEQIGAESGATLLELLVVTTILIFLAAFALPAYGDFTEHARQSKSAQDLRVIEEALEAYRADRGYYPLKLGDLTGEYLRPEVTFHSPWSSKNRVRYYFYIIEDTKYPTAFLLGDPGPQKYCNQDREVVLRAAKEELLPCGTNPRNISARRFGGSNPEVTLSPKASGPVASLSGFREHCNLPADKQRPFAASCIIKTER